MSGSLLVLLACALGPGDGDPDDAVDPADLPAGPVSLADANNYTFSGTLDGPTLPVAHYTDVTVSWAGLAEDLQCHAFDPVADVDNVALMWFRYLDEAQVEAGLAADTLQQVDMTVYLSHEPGDATSVTLSQLTFFGTEANIQTELAEDTGAWMIALTTGNTVGVGARMIAFLEPRADETADAVEIADGCDVLDYTVDLSSLTPVPVRAGGPWALDWSAVTTNGVGQPMVYTDVSEVMLAWFADTDVAALEGDFLDLETLADRRWTAYHPGGTTGDLATLTDVDDGSAFAGFTEDGLWLLALRCGSCPNPAPLVLTVLQPG
jgi:hypothetical protein